jgi:hypothetical protein
VPFHSPLPHQRRDGPPRRTGASRPRGIEALQRSAGNQAVGAILARFQDEEHTKAGNRRAILELEGLGTVEIESASLQGKSTLNITVREHAMTAQLHAAARNGTSFEHGRLVIGAASFDLRGVVIASIQMSGDVVSLTLDCSGITTTPAEVEEEAPPRRWDHDLPPAG